MIKIQALICIEKKGLKANISGSSFQSYSV